MRSDEELTQSSGGENRQFEGVSGISCNFLQGSVYGWLGGEGEEREESQGQCSAWVTGLVVL